MEVLELSDVEVREILESITWSKVQKECIGSGDGDDA